MVWLLVLVHLLLHIPLQLIHILQVLLVLHFEGRHWERLLVQ